MEEIFGEAWASSLAVSARRMEGARTRKIANMMAFKRLVFG
jgi:hypothetical protein